MGGIKGGLGGWEWREKGRGGTCVELNVSCVLVAEVRVNDKDINVERIEGRDERKGEKAD